MKTRAEILAQTPFSLSLSSGFFGYFAHLGFVQALEDRGLAPQALSGSSAGALVAAGLASGRSAKQLVEIFLNIQKKDFWDPRWGFGYLQGVRLEELLQQYCVQTFEQALVPLYISAFNIRHRRTEVISQGDIARACRASAAVPGLFHPVKVNANYFWDGGVRDRAGHKGVAHKDLVPVIHYLQGKDFFSKLEDRFLYRELHHQDFFFKTLSPYQIKPNDLTKGADVVSYFYQRTDRWLDERTQSSSI